MAVLRQRLAQRRAQGGDASEADEQVLEHLAGSDEALDPHEAERAIAIDAERPLEPAALARRWLDQR
jgi:hypothetical protein